MTEKYVTEKQRQVFSAAELVKLGRAPYCERCDLYMAPLNEPERPRVCRCWGCGAEAAWEWVN